MAKERRTLGRDLDMFCEHVDEMKSSNLETMLHIEIDADEFRLRKE